MIVVTTAKRPEKGLRGGHADCTFRRFERIFAVKRCDQV